jgi:large subunit ribosomal protein L9
MGPPFIDPIPSAESRDFFTRRANKAGLDISANLTSFFLTRLAAGPKSPPQTNLLPLTPMANAQVILKEKIAGLGAEADVVKVRAGYARNFLIPQGKAYEASRSNLRHVEALKTSRARREAEEILSFQEIATKISKLKPKFTLSTGQGGKAFGSVTSMDIHKQLEANGIVIDRHAIELEKPVKKSGKTEIIVRLHPQVSATLTISVDAGDEDKAG